MDRIKLPKIPFLDFEDSWSHLLGVPLAFTVKLDGSHVSFVYGDLFIEEYPAHHSFDLLREKHRQISHLLPKSCQFFGEWMHAKHFIRYKDDLALDDYLYVFAAFEKSRFLSLKDMKELCETFSICTIPIIYEDTFYNEWALIDKAKELLVKTRMQGHAGLIIRRVDSFPYINFVDHIARIGSNIKTSWASYPWEPNKLRKNKNEFFFN
jgi:RNA ligase